MNLENARTLVGELERLPDEKFHMGVSLGYVQHRQCGTVACIAGWAFLLHSPEAGNAHPWPGERRFAEQWLRLNSVDAEHLFMGKWSRHKNVNATTRAEAVDRLKKLIRIEEARTK